MADVKLIFLYYITIFRPIFSAYKTIREEYVKYFVQKLNYWYYVAILSTALQWKWVKSVE